MLGKFRTLRTILSCSVPLFLIGIPQAIAQTAEADAVTGAGQIEDIVVTAQKSAQNLQTVPIAVTAISGDTLARTQVTNIQALANAIPNVQINSFSNSPDSAVFTIRGVGVNDADPYVGTTVSVVVDGVPVGVNTAALLSLFDIERVEILRGPQGTLFGANTTGGVVNVITKQPTGKFGGEAQIVYGNYNRLDINAAMNFPITENLAGKVSVLHTGSDGFFRDTQDNRRLGKRDMTSLRGYLKYSVGDYDATLIAGYDRSRNDSQTGVMIAGPGELFYTPGETDQGINFRRGQSLDQPNFNNRDSYNGTLTQNLKTGIGDVVSITSYREYKNDLYSDDDGVSAILLQTHRTSKQHQFSQELRLHADLTDRIRMILGGFYFKQAYDLQQEGKLDGFALGLGQPQTQHQKNWSISGFAQFYADLTDTLRLQAGLRYSHEKTTATSTTANTFTTVPGGYSSFDDPLIPGSLIVANGSKAWNNVGYKVGVDWQATSGTLLYGYYARGFKSGGFTGRIAVAEDIGPFNPEHLDTFELGIKSDLLDRHLRLNLAAFYNNYNNMQVTQNLTYPSGANSAAIRNAGGAKTKGAELEITALPVEGITLTGSLAYLDAYYTTYDTFVLDGTGNTVPVSFAGNRLMNAPKWNATVGFSIRQPVGGGYVTATGQYSYTSSKYTAFTGKPEELVAPINLVNATLGWAPDGEAWSVVLWSRNLFNEKYYGQKLNLTGIGTLASLGNPREFGVDFKVHW
ncbi:TonB-dependent receptor [Sphingobium phenoxybenzoativorans]|uniref:TonB-dependent receptor n=1 Tax=Sphingobium phenoxybenzoativorans TaxID=1592790 RepID=UPI0009F56AE0|nr:TonB-dependent receptor [Sphingobium phenoxybenzoativorans]